MHVCRWILQKFLSESLNHLEKMYPGNGSGVTSSQQSSLDVKNKDGSLMNDMKKWRPDDPPTSNVVTSIRHSWPYNWTGRERRFVAAASRGDRQVDSPQTRTLTSFFVNSRQSSRPSPPRPPGDSGRTRGDN